MAHGVVLAGIGLQLGSIQSHVAQAHQPRLLTQPEHLNKQPTQDSEVAATEIADPAVVGLLVAGEHPEGGVFPAGLLDLPGAGQPDAVGVQEQHHHHPGVVGLLPAWILLAVDGTDWLQIQLSSQIEQKKHQVVLRQPVHR